MVYVTASGAHTAEWSVAPTHTHTRSSECTQTLHAHRLLREDEQADF